MRLKQFLSEDLNPVQTLMVKLLKGTSGIVNAKNIESIFNELDGWKIEPAILTNNTGRISNDEAKRFNVGHPHDVYQSGTSTDTTAEIYSSDKEALAKVHALFKKEELKTLPAKMKHKAFYYMNVTPIKKTKGYGKDIYAFNVEPHYAGKGYVITGPGKLRYEEKLEAGYKGLTWWDFMKWIKDEGKRLTTDMQAVVGDPTAKKKRPTVEGVTDECQICEGIQKLNKGKLVLHGYKRPGYGYTVGNCFGYNALPYSKSSDRCEEYKGMMRVLKRDRKKEISNLKTGKVKEITIPKYVGAKRETEVIGPTHPKWKESVEHIVRNLENDIKAIDREIERMDKRIKNWEPK